MSRNSDIGASFRESRDRNQAYRRGLAECYICDTKNGTEARECRNCGSPNQNYVPGCSCLKCKREIQTAADVCGEIGCPIKVTSK